MSVADSILFDQVQNLAGKTAKLLENFGCWIDNGEGVAKYSYPQNSIVKYGGDLYKKFSPGTLSPGAAPPSVDLLNWSVYAPGNVLSRSGNLSELEDFEEARYNLDVYSKAETSDLGSIFGDSVVSRDSLGNVQSIITTTPEGHTKTELFTYNAKGDLATLRTILSHMGIDRIETYLYDSSGDFIGIEV